MKNHCWNAQTSVFLLAVRSVAHRNDDFAAITSWCWGYEHGACKELLTVHGYPVIGVMPADSVSSPSRNWVSRIFHRVTTHRPGVSPPSFCRSTWCFFVFPHHRFHGHDALCFTDWAFSPHTGDTSHLQVKRGFIGLNDGLAVMGNFLSFLLLGFFWGGGLFCFLRAWKSVQLWVNAICGSYCATLSWTWSVDYVMM